MCVWVGVCVQQGSAQALDTLGLAQKRDSFTRQRDSWEKRCCLLRRRSVIFAGHNPPTLIPYPYLFLVSTETAYRWTDYNLLPLPLDLFLTPFFFNSMFYDNYDYDCGCLAWKLWQSNTQTSFKSTPIPLSCAAHTHTPTRTHAKLKSKLCCIPLSFLAVVSAW